MTCSYQAPDRWSALPEEAFAAITPAGTQAGTRVLGYYTLKVWDDTKRDDIR